MAIKATATVTVFNVSDGTDGRMLYATCQTAPLTAAKVATVSSGTVTLYTGLTVAVQFMHTNTAASPTLNINGTGAKAIFVNGNAITAADYWVAGATNTFVYDGSRWVMSDVQSVDVGGTNLVPFAWISKAPTNMSAGTSTQDMTVSWWVTDLMTKAQMVEQFDPGGTYTVHYDAEFVEPCSGHNGVHDGKVGLRFYSASTSSADRNLSTSLVTSADYSAGRTASFTQTFTLPGEFPSDYRLIGYTPYFRNSSGSPAIKSWATIRNLKIEKGTVPTDWSPAPGDVQTGIDDAQGTANAGIKEQVTLFYASASATTPSKPTANVTTSSADTYAAWNRTLPTYRSANPYLYVCTQSLTNGGVYSWSSVEPGSYADWAAALGTRLTIAETNIRQNASDIALKASQTDVSSLGTRVSTAEANIDANRAAIALKVSQAQFDAMQVGGTNMLAGTRDFSGWTIPSGCTSEEVDGFTVLTIAQSSASYINVAQIDIGDVIQDSSEYVYSFWVKASLFGIPAVTYLYSPDNTAKNPCASNVDSFGSSSKAEDGSVWFTVPTKWTRVWCKRTTKSGITGSSKRVIALRIGVGSTGGTVSIKQPKLEVGNVPTDWSPAPEDMATSAELEVTAEGINQRVDGLDGNIAEVATTANSFSVQLESAIDKLTGSIDTNTEKIETVTAMVSVTSDNGRPVLGLGSSGSPLAVQLTNEQLSFIDSSVAVAHINGQRLNITTAEVTGMLRMGNFAWVPISDDGSLALKLVG